MYRRFNCSVEDAKCTAYVGTAAGISRLWRNLYRRAETMYWLNFPWSDPPRFNRDRLYALEIEDEYDFGTGRTIIVVRVLRAEDLFRYEKRLEEF